MIVAICDDSGDTEYRYTTFGFYLEFMIFDGVRFSGIWVVDNERNSGVTHWMPLPELPKEGGGEDVVEVVRCKDCIHAGDRDCPIDWPKNGEDYCSFGERRDDNG